MSPPPTAPSIGQRLVDMIPVKVTCLAILLIPLIPYMVDVHYLDVRGHTPASMCSPHYPSYSRVLDVPVILPDGGVQAGGRVYPPGAVWWHSGVARGCPCSIGPCIRPCCPHGYYKRNVSLDFTELLDYICSDLIDEELEKSRPLRVLSTSTSFEMVKIPNDHFTVLEANCLSKLDFDEHAILTVDGLVEVQRGSLSAAKYGICFNVRGDQLMSNMVFACPESLITNPDEDLRAIRVSTTFTLVLGFVAALLLLTLVTYLLTPHLRPAHCGWSLVSYNVSLLVFKILQIINAWSDPYLLSISKYTDLIMTSWANSIMMWQGLIAFQMWTVFSPGQLRVDNRDGEHSRIICYSVLIWGSVVVFALWKLFSPEMMIDVYVQCVVLFVTLCLNISALLRIRACLKDSKIIQGADSQRHNVKECQWASLFLKFSMVTSLDFTVVLLVSNMNYVLVGSQVQTNSPARYLFGLQSYFVSLRGVEIFFLNVWKKKTWTILKRRIYSKNSSNAVRMK